eukprot:3215995-Heterocapsa_arctica.AAC.1
MPKKVIKYQKKIYKEYKDDTDEEEELTDDQKEVVYERASITNVTKEDERMVNIWLEEDPTRAEKARMEDPTILQIKE